MDKYYVLNTANNFLILSTKANEEIDDIVIEFDSINYKRVDEIMHKWNRSKDPKYLKILFKYKA